MAQVKSVKLVNAAGNVFREASDPRKIEQLKELGYREVEAQEPAAAAPKSTGKKITV